MKLTLGLSLLLNIGIERPFKISLFLELLFSCITLELLNAVAFITQSKSKTQYQPYFDDGTRVVRFIGGEYMLSELNLVL